jgi:hypothetical protein
MIPMRAATRCRVVLANSRPAPVFGEAYAMQQIQYLTLTWMRPARVETAEGPTGPLPVPDRARIRRVAEIYFTQVKEAERVGQKTDEILRQQVEALRAFTLELSPEAVHDFMNMFTEESSALEREWLARKRDWRPRTGIPPGFVTALIFLVTILAIALAIRFAIRFAV